MSDGTAGATRRATMLLPEGEGEGEGNALLPPTDPVSEALVRCL